MYYGTSDIFFSGKAHYPESISSGPLGPSIAIGIYDPVNRVAYLREQTCPDADNDMETFIQDALKEFPKKRARVVVTGGAYDVNDTQFITAEGVLSDRRFVEQLVEKYFEKRQVTIKWTEHNLCSELIVDTSKGRYQIRMHSFNEPDDDPTDDFNLEL